MLPALQMSAASAPVGPTRRQDMPTPFTLDHVRRIFAVAEREAGRATGQEVVLAPAAAMTDGDGFIAAPIFNADGTLLGVVGIASLGPELSGSANASTCAIIERSARAPAPARGGLPPRALRRVREYIDAHMEERVGLKELAGVAGLSVFHFARAFKQSQGVTPNFYLFQRRVERAQQLLAESDLPLSEIAIATGFSDQSHFARRFREQVGTTPAKFRWSKR